MLSGANDNGGEVRCADVLVIGAGQAGLAAANELSKAGIDFLVIDGAAAVGDSWRQRYESLTLFTPRSISSLPGLPLVGDPDGYATKDEFADYLARYAEMGGYRVESRTRITSLRRDQGVFEASCDDGRLYSASAVIIATGPFSKPRVPSISYGFANDVQQMHVADFRSEGSVAEGPVLVVGDGASGRDVALALATTHSVFLARGRNRKLIPERILGRSTWWWLKRLGLLGAKPDSFIGQRMRQVDPFPNRGNDDRTLARRGVILKPRLVSVEGREAVFSDGSHEALNAVIWATGYEGDFGWIGIKGAVGPNGRLLYRKGVSPVPGLYFLGMPWQRNRASALIAGAGADAAYVVQRLKRWIEAHDKSPPAQL